MKHMEPEIIEEGNKNGIGTDNQKAIIKANDDSISRVASSNIDLRNGKETIKKNFPVTGLSCASCAINVENKLKTEPGVISASVNYANNNASVEYMPEVASVQHFKTSVQSIGYDLNIDETAAAADELENQQENNYQILKKRVFLSLAFSVPLLAIGMVFMNIPYASFIMWALA